MEDWVRRALAKWPNVPALFGWLRLDRRGRWLIRGEPITRPQIIDTINRNFEADARGRWFFQNGPQRGYVELEYAPLVLHGDGERLTTHTGLIVERPAAVYLDEDGALLLQTEHGPGVLDDHSLDWALARLSVDGREIDDADLAGALGQDSGETTALRFELGGIVLPVTRLDSAEAPAQLRYERLPQPDS